MRLPVSLELARFAVVTALGLGIDLSIAWVLAARLGLALPLAALAGFLVAAAFNYVLHEFWTFGGKDSRLSPTRGLAYLAGLGLTLATRLAVVVALSGLLPARPGNDLPILIAAVGCSFFVNYAFSKYFVFRNRLAARGALALNDAESNNE